MTADARWQMDDGRCVMSGEWIEERTGLYMCMGSVATMWLLVTQQPELHPAAAFVDKYDGLSASTFSSELS